MLEVIEKLLILQDRDRKILRVETELANIAPERNSLQNKLESAQTALESAKHLAKQIESERKRLELEVDSRKQQIEKYSIQQFQTKKNEEYKALAKEIENCKAVIIQLEDQQLEQMEKAEKAQTEVTKATTAFAEAKKVVDQLAAQIGDKETALTRQLGELKQNYESLAEGIDEGALTRYQRLRKSKGENAIVGIDRGVCGGCHMKLPIQILRSCQGAQEIVTCSNCGRILYHTPHMDLVAAE